MRFFSLALSPATGLHFGPFCLKSSFLHSEGNKAAHFSPRTFRGCAVRERMRPKKRLRENKNETRRQGPKCALQWNEGRFVLPKIERFPPSSRWGTKKTVDDTGRMQDGCRSGPRIRKIGLFSSPLSLSLAFCIALGPFLFPSHSLSLFPRSPLGL